MSLEIKTFSLGPLENNVYVLVDSTTRNAAIIDPGYDLNPALQWINSASLTLNAIWITHAHFDHIAGVSTARAATPVPPVVALHPDDLPLWQNGGGSQLFGFPPIHDPQPDVLLTHQQTLQLGAESLTVYHTPGHSPGHVVFHSPSAGVVLCGDLIFYRGVGRTDLPGSNPKQLVDSIRRWIYTLPPQTILLPGHGPKTTVEEEIRMNPFVGLHD